MYRLKGPLVTRSIALIALMLVLVPAACGPIKSKDTAISTAEQAIGAVHVTRSDAKAMTWSEWQQRSGNRGGPVPAPSSGTRVWVVALQGQFTKLGRSAPAAAVVLDAGSGKMILAETGDWDWPPYWDAL